MRILMMPDYRADNPYQDLLARAMEEQGARVEFARGYRRGLPLFRASALGAPGYDVLHLHWVSPYLKGRNMPVKLLYAVKFLLDVLLVRAAGVRVVWTIHNRLAHNTEFPRVELWTRRALARLAHALIVHSRAFLDQLGADLRFDPHKVAVVPHGHYRDVYAAPVPTREARRALGLPSGGMLYLNLGMLRPYKGVERLLEVWRARGARFHADTLLIAGKALNPDYEGQLRTLAGNEGGVLLRPEFVAPERVHLYFSAADAVVLPFEQILTSGSLLLAMSYGKPIIAPRTPGIAETLSGCGDLLYAPEAADGLRSALEKSKLIDLSELSGRVARQCDLLEWGAIGKTTLATYAGQAGITPGAVASMYGP